MCLQVWTMSQASAEFGPAVDGARRELFLELLCRFGRARLRVNGASMVPSLWPGDVVEVVRVPSSEIRLRNIVLLERDGRFFCHRVIELFREGNSTLLRTKGDALHDCDPPAAPAQVLGVVGAVEHHVFLTCRWILVELRERFRRSLRLSAVLGR